MPLPITTPVRSGVWEAPFQPRLGHGLMGGGERELGKEIVPLGLLAVHVLQRIEALHLTGEADLQVGSIELGDGRGT